MKKIIEMAREAGFSEWALQTPEDLERFATLVAAEKEQQMIEAGWRKCAVGQRTTQFCGLLDEAVKAERERLLAGLEMPEPAYVCAPHHPITGQLTRPVVDYYTTDQLREFAAAAVARERKAGEERVQFTKARWEIECGSQVEIEREACAKDRQDAARYRHMRNNAQFQSRNGPGLYWYLPRFPDGDKGQQLDDAIDAAIRARGLPPTQGGE